MSGLWQKLAHWVQDRTPGYDWGEHIGLIAMAVLLAPLSLGVAYLLGEWDVLPGQLLALAALAGLVISPVCIVGRHKHRQDRLLDRIRAVFLRSTTYLMQERVSRARRGLDRIRRMERRWTYGASYPYRLALMSSVIITNAAIALVYLVSSQHVGVQAPNGYTPFHENLRKLWESAFGVYIAIGMAVLFALPNSIAAFHITSRQWADFYGDRLEAALRAGRGIDEAPQHEDPELPRDGVNAMELLGLSSGFTKQELRKAWLRLARELHPDRWSASGEAVRAMKEAALKRVNAARDELAARAR